jgi:hypothetical protein
MLCHEGKDPESRTCAGGKLHQLEQEVSDADALLEPLSCLYLHLDMCFSANLTSSITKGSQIARGASGLRNAVDEPPTT